MLISKDALYLQKILSSKLFEVTYKSIFSSVELGEHGYQYNKHALIKLPIIASNHAKEYLYNITDVRMLDKEIYKLYKLSEDEIMYIENQ